MKYSRRISDILNQNLLSFKTMNAQKPMLEFDLPCYLLKSEKINIVLRTTASKGILSLLH